MNNKTRTEIWLSEAEMTAIPIETWMLLGVPVVVDNPTGGVMSNEDKARTEIHMSKATMNAIPIETRICMEMYGVPVVIDDSIPWNASIWARVKGHQVEFAEWVEVLKPEAAARKKPGKE